MNATQNLESFNAILDENELIFGRVVPFLAHVKRGAPQGAVLAWMGNKSN